MPAHDQIEGLLADLSTITDVARAGVISKHDERLEPGEMRPVAVLFLDVVGFTPLTKQIGAEQITRLIDRTFRIFELTAKAHGGYVTGFAGDSAHYIFAGHPNYPPVCEAALRTALKLKERVRQVNESLSETGITIILRTGISFGEVTVQAVGSEKAQTTIMGDAINIAQRLESTAKPGTIQTTAPVLAKAGDIFLSKPLGAKELKGYGMVMTYEVTGIEERPVELRGAFHQLAPLVGRDDVLEQATKQIELWLETAHARETFDIAATSTPLKAPNKLMILRGVTAVGKSRLAYEIVKKLRVKHGIATATVHCTKGSSVGGFAAELADVASVDASNLPGRWEELCAHATHAVSPDYAERQRRHLLLLAHVLGCRKVDTSGFAAADADSFETNCKLALRACCELTAHHLGKPVVLIIEDLQWLGGLRGMVTDLLNSACLPQPLVVVATARPEYSHEDGGLGEGEARRYELAPLGAADGDSMLQTLLPGLVLPAALAEELHSKAAGIPYYYEELARMLVRRGLVTELEDSYALAKEIVELDVPEDICALILGRLDQLEPELKALAMRASVLGRSFQYKLLAAIEAQLGFTGEDHPNHGLVALTAHKVLAREAGDRYFFEHILTREAAYSALLRCNRQLLHHAAAQVLEQIHVPGGADEMQLLSDRTQHLYHAQQYLEAYNCSAKLLMIKARSGRYEDWDRWEGIAQECLASAEDENGTRRAISSALMRARGVKQLRHGNYDAAREHFEKSLVSAREAGDKLGEASALCDLGILCRQAGMTAAATEHYQRSLKMARQLEERHMEAVILGNIGKIHYQQGQADLANEHYEQALAISRGHGDKRTEAMMLVYLGTTHLDHDDNELAYDLFSQVLDLARETGNRVAESIALSNMGVAAHALGKSEAVLQLWREAAAIDREIGRREGEAFLMFNLGELACESQEPGTALEHYEAALALFRELQDVSYTILAVAEVGKVLSLLGRLEDAARALTEATTLCDNSRNMAERGITECCWVHYYIAVRDLHQAQAHLDRARRIAQRSSAGAQSQLGSEIAQAEKLIADVRANH